MKKSPGEILLSLGARPKNELRRTGRIHRVTRRQINNYKYHDNKHQTKNNCTAQHGTHNDYTHNH